MCRINIDKYLLARYKQGGRTLPDVDCYGLVLEFFKNELKINLPLEQSITDISQAPEGEKNFKKIVKYAEVTEINLERDKIYLLPDVDCYGLVLEFFKNELKINLPLEQSITDISQAPEGEKNFKKIVKYAEVTEINLERDKIYLCGFYTKNNFLAHCGIVIDKKILHINKNGAVLQSIGTIKRIYSLWSLKFYEITRNCRT